MSDVQHKVDVVFLVLASLDLFFSVVCIIIIVFSFHLQLGED